MTDTDLPTIIHCILAAIAALIVAIPIIVFTVRVKVGIEANEKFSLWVSFLGIRYTIFPKKPKKYNLRDYTPKKIAERDRKAEEAARAKAASKAKKRAERAAKKRKRKAESKKLTAKQRRVKFREELEKWPHIDDSANLLFTVLEEFFTSFAGRFHFHVARIRIAVGSENAARTALLTTVIDSSLDPLLFFIDQNSNLHVSRNADICVYPDFLSEKIKYDVKLAFSMSLGSFLLTVIKTAITGYVGWKEIQPEEKKNGIQVSANKAAPTAQRTASATQKTTSTAQKTSPTVKK